MKETALRGPCGELHLGAFIKDVILSLKSINPKELCAIYSMLKMKNTKCIHKIYSNITAFSVCVKCTVSVLYVILKRKQGRISPFYSTPTVLFVCLTD